MLGVYSLDLTAPMAEVLRLLGLQRAMVVHGSGLDEITTTGETMVSELDGGIIRSYTIPVRDVRHPPAEIADLAGGDAGIQCTDHPGDPRRRERVPARDIVLMNAAAAIYVGGEARDLHEGIRRAAASIDSGNALSRLDSLVEATRSAA